MATVSDIERLKALVDRLLPLSARVRGEVIAADDWNTVVGALLEVARAVVADTVETAVPDHDHPDQVTLGWLDPGLRALIERGPLADPASTSRMTAVERQAALIGRQLDEVSAHIRDLRVVTQRQETNDLDRASSLTALSRTVSGFKDPRNEIAALRASLDVIGTNVSAVSAFAAGLGQLTPAAVLAGLAKVDQLQNRLTTATGTLLDAAEFERRLTELRTTLVTEEELTEALKNRPVQLSEAAKAQLLDESKVAAQRQAETSVTTLNETLRNQLNTRIDEVAKSAVQAARAAAAGFREELQTAITTQLTTIITEGQRAGEDRLNAKVDAAQTILRGAVDERITRLEGSLDNRVTAAITAARPDLLAQLNANLEARVSGLDNRLAAAQKSLADVQRGLAAATNELAAVRQGNINVQEQVGSLRADLLSEQNRVNLALKELQQQIPPPSQGITTRELAAALARNNDQLRAELQTTTIAIVNKQLDERLGRPPIRGPRARPDDG